MMQQVTAKPRNQVILDAINAGYSVTPHTPKQKNPWITISGIFGDVEMSVAYNTHSGNFIVPLGDAVATEQNNSLRTERWYSDIWQLVYGVEGMQCH